MPWLIPIRRTAFAKNSKSFLFSKFRVLDESELFVLQERKKHLSDALVKKRPSVNHNYRIVTKGTMPYYEIGYHNDLEEIKKGEWSYCKEKIPQLMPSITDSSNKKQQLKWILAHFTQKALEEEVDNEDKLELGGGLNGGGDEEGDNDVLSELDDEEEAEAKAGGIGPLPSPTKPQTRAHAASFHYSDSEEDAKSAKIKNHHSSPSYGASPADKHKTSFAVEHERTRGATVSAAHNHAHYDAKETKLSFAKDVHRSAGRITPTKDKLPAHTTLPKIDNSSSSSSSSSSSLLYSSYGPSNPSPYHHHNNTMDQSSSPASAAPLSSFLHSHYVPRSSMFPLSGTSLFIFLFLFSSLLIFLIRDASLHSVLLFEFLLFSSLFLILVGRPPLIYIYMQTTNTQSTRSLRAKD